MNTNRDILYFIQRNGDSGDTISREWDAIHVLLYSLETIAYFASCVEIIDVNKYKIIRKPHLKEQVLRQPYLKPFQFVNTLN